MGNTCHPANWIRVWELLLLFGLAQAASRTYYVNGIVFYDAWPMAYGCSSFNNGVKLKWQDNNDESQSE